MTKSRTPLSVFLVALSWSGAAQAQPFSPITAEEILAAYEARIHEAMGSVDGRCPRGAEDGAIIVCGRDHDASMRLPLPSEPEEGSRHRLLAGEAPSGRAALDVGAACCGGGGGIDIIGLAGALGRGVGRILHPD